MHNSAAAQMVAQKANKLGVSLVPLDFNKLKAFFKQE